MSQPFIFCVTKDPVTSDAPCYADKLQGAEAAEYEFSAQARLDPAFVLIRMLGMTGPTGGFCTCTCRCRSAEHSLGANGHRCAWLVWQRRFQQTRAVAPKNTAAKSLFSCYFSWLP